MNCRVDSIIQNERNTEQLSRENSLHGSGPWRASGALSIHSSIFFPLFSHIMVNTQEQRQIPSMPVHLTHMTPISTQNQVTKLLETSLTYTIIVQGI
jgi:hypothetical protein